jgi:hypothetical protein
MRVLAFLLPLALVCGAAHGAEIERNLTITVKVGETRQIGVYGAHSKDCSRSIAPSIHIVKSPTKGSITQRESVSYIVKRSISGTCLGANLFGTAVDYTASARGHDFVTFDAEFSNGKETDNVTINVR